MTLVLWVDGTWSRGGARSAVSEEMRRQTEARGWRFAYVDYPAQFGPATGVDHMSMEASVAVGVKELENAVRATPETRVIVGGYSQGAIVAVRFVHDVLPRAKDLIVMGLATIADPHTPVHGNRSGIAGAINVALERFTVWAAGDPIADLPLGSPMRSLADLGAWMTLRTPEERKRWATEIAKAAAQRRLQSWWAPWRWADLASVGWYVGNYLGTAHTTDYVRQGLVKRLVDDLVRHYGV
ncbi:lysin B [Gordonia phage Sour]|uniref:Lysin B n=1 Tax=Gordonia phage Sour TaxID=2182349 RepID=A0A2U8UKX9_9CAUD|nr:lysin B [Gordonia phage Sour]AWN04248.1 lysin B [Gordonia phage Sour]